MNVASSECKLLPLGLLAEGDSADVVQAFGAATHGGGHGPHGHGQGMQAGLMRLEDMGLRPGARVEVLTNEGHGPLLLKVGEARIAIGRGIAMKLQVRPVAARGQHAGNSRGCNA